MTTRPTRQPPIWLLVLGLVTAAGSVALFELVGREGFGISTWWIWPVSIIAFVIADVTVVRVHFGAEVTAFTFIELPLFVGAIYVSPTLVWGALSVGVAISVLLIQRLTFMKAAFNIANLSLQGAVALWVFHSVIGSANPLGPRGWIGAAVAAVLSIALSFLILGVVLIMVQGSEALRGLGQTLFMGALTGVANVSLALIGASLIDYRPITLVLLVLPTAVLYGSYRAYTSERRQRDRVQALHELALEARSIREEAGIAPVLRLAAEHLEATHAELVLFPDPRSGDNAKRFTVHGDDELVTDVVSGELASALDLVHALTTPQLRATTQGENTEIAGTIYGEGRAMGSLLVRGRQRDASAFSSDDLAMFQTIIEQLGLTFEKNQLGQAVSQLERRGRELQHEAYHDGLTGLANREFLFVRLESELQCKRTPSLLYVDLDDFKYVNDEYGHAGGDQVLVEIARRFDAAVGSNDCVARIGGDEFAVLLGEHSDDIGVANALLAVAAEPIELADGIVRVNASIGIARAHKDADAAGLLKSADLAMYRAKDAGKGSLVLG